MDASLIPYLVAAAGIAGGALWAWRLMRHEPPVSEEVHRLDLAISDLQIRRNELFEQLRGAEGVELEPADAQILERDAAVTLRELDRLQAERDKLAPRKPKARHREQPTEAARTSWVARHPLMAGFLLGSGMVALLAVLIVVAARDAQPAPEGEGGTMAARTQQASPSPPAAGGPPGAQDAPPLAEPVAAELESLRSQLDGSPRDAQVRARIADLLLANSRFFDAFQEAQTLLEIDPENADGHYVEGVVRYMMGQPDEAYASLDRALAYDPGHVQGALMKGVFLLREDDLDGAVTVWEQALAAGGPERRLEHLLGLAREGKSPQEILAAPPP